MSPDLETRLRRELQEMAGKVEPAPDTWESIKRRASARSRTRRAVLAAAAAVVLVVSTAAIIRPWRDDPRVTTGVAWSVDQLSVGQRVDVGLSLTSSDIRPRTNLASDGSDVWFSRLGSTKVAQLDPVAARVRSSAETRFPVVGVAVAPDSVWAVSHGYAEAVRIDRQTGDVTRVALRTGDQRHPATGGIAYGARAVWVPVTGDRLARLDLESGAVEVIDVGVTLRFVVAGGGTVWGVGDAGTVIAVDPEQRAVIARAELGAGDYRIDHGEGAVWVLDMRGDLVKLSPDLGSQHRTRVGADPHDLAAGAGAVWVTDELARSLVVVDPNSAEVRAEIDIDARPGDVVVAGDQIWISEPDAGTLVSVALR